MSVPCHIRRFVVIALLGCAILAGSSSTATARPLYDRTVETTSSAEPSTSAASEAGDSTLPLALAAAVVVLLAGAAGYSYRVRTRRRVTA
jgi:hypothetical protein